MSIRNRPYIGNWQMNRTLVRHTPDALVYINGHAEFEVCATCHKKLDLNKYITSVSCEPSTESISGASVGFSIPKTSSDVFSHDGNYVLRPGLEVVIYMRGYFPMEGYALLGQNSQEDDAPVYPYYQVFRGVVTEASHEFSGGFYTANLSCSTILNFWQNQYLSTNGAVFGPRPANSGVAPDLSGHSFTGASPYSIVYTLMRTGFGAAYSVGWSIGQKTNISAVDETSGESLYHHAAEWWEKRWQSSTTRLRMYGFDGSMFNAFEQSYVGMFGSGASRKFIYSYNSVPDGNTTNFDMTEGRLAAARVIGYNGSETTAAFMDSNGYRLDILKMQAFTYDLGRVANVNFFETEYMSKMEIAEAVKEITGFELYQDVDGDIVFKPPFYNMDTSDDPVYCIEDRDLISISESETEPEATYVKGTGGLFGNTTGVLSGEFGTKQGMYVDWRLVAQFGWREASFESHYLNNATQLFVSAISRLDIANASTKTAQISIPIRPELRPGYPVYVRSLDCFFYVKSISHSFSPGSECTTSITGIAKRSKFLPPGMPDRSDGRGSSPLPKLDNVKLSEPGSYPPMPLYVFPEDISGDRTGEPSGPPRIIGFPNCVMALDPRKVNFGVLGSGELISSYKDNFFPYALTLGVLRRAIGWTEENQIYELETGDGRSIIITKDQFTTKWSQYYTAVVEWYRNPSKENTERMEKQFGDDKLATAIKMVTSRYMAEVENSVGLQNWLAIQRSLRSMYGFPAVTGSYRYFSSASPNEEDQSPSQLLYRESTQQPEFETPGAPSGSNEYTILTQDGDRIKIQTGKPKRALRVYGFTGLDKTGYKDICTGELRFVSFQMVKYFRDVVLSTRGASSLASFLVDKSSYKDAIRGALLSSANSCDASQSTSKVFGDVPGSEVGYQLILGSIQKFERALGVSVTGKEKYSSIQTALGTIYNKSVVTVTEETVTVVNPTQDWLKNSGEGFTSSGTRDANGNLVFTGKVKRSTKAPAQPKYGGRDPTSEGVIMYRYGKTKGKTQFNAISDISDDLSGLLAEYMDLCQQALKEKLGESGDYSPYISARNTMLSVLEGYKESSPGQVQASGTKEEEVISPTPILPVSDNRGYQVYGGLAYGRGINISTQYKLLALSSTGKDAASFEIVEAFVAGLIATGGNVPAVLGTLDEDRKAQLAAVVGVESGASTEEFVAAIEKLKKDSQSEVAFIRNAPITSKTRGMSTTEEVNYREIVNLTVGEENGVCLCKGVEASYFLQAFTGEFVQLNEGAVNEFLKDQATAAGESWKVTRDAVSGKAPSTRLSLSAGIDALVGYGEDTARNAENIAESITSIPGTITDVTGG